MGAISAVKIRLTQKGLWQDFWYLEQVNIFELASVSIFLYIQEGTNLERKDWGGTGGEGERRRGKGAGLAGGIVLQFSRGYVAP